MTTRMAKMAVAAGLLLAGLPAAAQAAAESPVAMLMQVNGTVEQSHDGSTWKPVTRNKHLFPGDLVRTGADGSAGVVDESNNTRRALGPNSQIKVEVGGVSVGSGSLGAPEPLAGDLVAGLSNRFAEAQRYTTVRRSAFFPFKVAGMVTLSSTYPDLVWQNEGKTLSYRLIIDGNATPVPATEADVVRTKLSKLTPGSHSFTVEVVENGKVIEEPENKKGVLVWLSAAEDKEVADALAKVKKTSGGDAFAEANLLDDKGLTVAAMDLYRKHFAEDATDNDMRPLLIRAYHDLALQELQHKEVAVYQNAR